MFEKLLGKKKSSDEANGKVKTKKKGGFLELDEIEDLKNPGEIAQVAAKVVTQAVTEVKEVVTEAVGTTVEAVETAVDTTVESVKGKVGKKDKKETAKKPETKTERTPAPAAPAYEQPEWVKVMYKNPNETQTPAEPAGFATEYQTPTSTTSRRRPGPSLNKFVNLARQVKKPGNRG